jgi:hypothetical protein
MMMHGTMNVKILFISQVVICHTSASYIKMLLIIVWEIYNFLFFVRSLCHQIEFKAFIAGAYGYGEELSSSINAGNFLTSGKVYC